MTVTAGYLTKRKKEKNRKDVRAAQATVNKMSDASRTVWVAPCKQYCL